MQVCSFATHFFAHDTPAPTSKQLAKSVWNWAEQAPPSVPAWRQSLKSPLAVRRQAVVASLNGGGGGGEVVVLLVVVVFTVEVVTVWAATWPAPPTSTAHAMMPVATASNARNIPALRLRASGLSGLPAKFGYAVGSPVDGRAAPSQGGSLLELDHRIELDARERRIARSRRPVDVVREVAPGADRERV